MRTELPNLLILCGAGKNTGKTTITRHLINKYKETYKVAAVKISPHFHDNNQSGKRIWTRDGANVFIENEISQKDSSLFLQTGAEPVFYVESKEEMLTETFAFIINYIGDQRLIICESAQLASYYKPGILIYLESLKVDKVKVNKLLIRQLADIIINVGEIKLENELEAIANDIEVVNQQWKLSQRQDVINL